MSKPRNFVVAFLIQKAAEFVLLCACMAVAAFAIGHTSDAAEWAVPAQVSVLMALYVGFTTATLFYVFTLYPLVTFIVVWAFRKFIGVWIPIFSALSSLAYVLLWLAMMPVGIGYVFPGFWSSTVVMVAFIWLTSKFLYPARERA